MKEFVKKVSQKISKLSPEQLEQLINSITAENTTFGSIMESLSTGLLITDNDWHLMRRNKAAERLLPFTMRLSDPHAEGVEVWKLIDDSEISSYLKKCSESKKTNVSDEFSFSYGEKIRFVNISVVPLVQKMWNEQTDVTDTSIAGSIITIDDVTEKRQQEILLHRMESLASLTNLAASVAHEIKNPLGAISIHIQLLQRAVKKAREGDGLLPAEKYMENYLQVVNEEIDSLNRIVLDFLFAVRPVQAKMQLSNPDELIERFVDFFMPEFESKNVGVELKLCKNSGRLMLDEKLFREVLVNLTQNAIAAMEGKRGALCIRSCVKEDNYLLTVQDNGSGMDEETSSHVFEPYYTTKANGTGLGLTTVYKIIKEFRGDIRVNSAKGRGTVFTITLPVPQHNIKLLPQQRSS